jgi:hypothetical protein
MIFTSLVLLALTLFVAWDSSLNAGQHRLSGAAQPSNRRKLGFARRRWALARSSSVSTNTRMGNELVLTPAYCPAVAEAGLVAAGVADAPSSGSGWSEDLESVCARRPAG